MYRKDVFSSLLSIKFKCLFWTQPEPSKVWAGSEPLAWFSEAGEVGGPGVRALGHSSSRGSAPLVLSPSGLSLCVT